jgi:predicted lipoprotein with Yx(FWY)xxD motif
MHNVTIGRLASTVALLTLAACGASTAVVGNGGGATPTSTPHDPSAQTSLPAAATVRTINVAGIGTVLADAQGRTLYYFLAERGGNVACLGQCASIWPPQPAPTTTVTAVRGVPGEFGMVTRPDGAAQLTYNTWPLYTFAKDTGSGEATGQGINHFFAATPSLTASTGLPATTAQPTPMATSQHAPMAMPQPRHAPTAPPTSRPSGRPTPCIIPQNGGGDGDADNFGAPSDGDGCDR